jgi:hypothetical protein
MLGVFREQKKPVNARLSRTYPTDFPGKDREGDDACFNGLKTICDMVIGWPVSSGSSWPRGAMSLAPGPI